MEKLGLLLGEIEDYNFKYTQYKNKVKELDSIDEELIKKKCTESLIALKVCPICGSKITEDIADMCVSCV